MSFQAPIGTAALRASGKIWPGSWLDATGFLTKYAIGIHTGADLNLPADADKNSPVYAIGDGTVTYAQTYPNPNAWGNIVVIDHGTVDGKPLFSRYGHVGKIMVSVGQSVRMGDQISSVGNGNGLFAYHLHFDISTTDILRNRPGNWPAPSTNPDPSLVKAHYVDPLKWLKDHLQTPPPPPPPSTTDLYIIATAGLNLRERPGTSATKRGLLPYGLKVSIEVETVETNSYIWGQLRQFPYKGLWIALSKSDNSEVYVSDNPPES
jgi:Peptidase family M23